MRRNLTQIENYACEYNHHDKLNVHLALITMYPWNFFCLRLILGQFIQVYKISSEHNTSY